MALSCIVSDIFANLDILIAIEPHQTLLVNGDKLGVDGRYFQSLCRAWTRDSRDSILHAIQKTLLHWEEVLCAYHNCIRLEQSKSGTGEQSDTLQEVYDYLIQMQNRRELVVRGLNRLTTFQRYAHDTTFKIDIQRFIVRIQKLTRKCTKLANDIAATFPKVAEMAALGASDALAADD